MSHLYTPAVMRQIFAQQSDAAMQSVAEFSTPHANALQVYAEYFGATSLTIVPWVKFKIEHQGAKRDLWVPLTPVVIPAVVATANGFPPIIPGADQSGIVLVPIPNAFAVKLELVTIVGGGSVRLWAAPVSASTAIA